MFQVHFTFDVTRKKFKFMNINHNMIMRKKTTLALDNAMKLGRENCVEGTTSIVESALEKSP